MEYRLRYDVMLYISMTVIGKKLHGWRLTVDSDGLIYEGLLIL